MRKRDKGEKKHREGEIPTGSFSDIAFLLIVYFIIATTLLKVKSITADMPAGEKSSQSQNDKTPIVNLRGEEIFSMTSRSIWSASTNASQPSNSSTRNPRIG